MRRTESARWSATPIRRLSMRSGLGSVNSVTLGFSDAAPGAGGNAGAQQSGKTYAIKGTATGVRHEQPAAAAAGDEAIRDDRDLPVARANHRSLGRTEHMSRKRVIGAAAVAAGVVFSAMTVNAGSARSVTQRRVRVATAVPAPAAGRTAPQHPASAQAARDRRPPRRGPLRRPRPASHRAARPPRRRAREQQTTVAASSNHRRRKQHDAVQRRARATTSLGGHGNQLGDSEHTSRRRRRPRRKPSTTAPSTARPRR